MDNDSFVNIKELNAEIERILNRRVCSNQQCKATYNLTMSPSKVEGICDKCGAQLIQRKDDNKEVIMQDERLSTVEANRMLISNDTKRKNRKKVVDKIAATIILQSYLDRRNNER